MSIKLIAGEKGKKGVNFISAMVGFKKTYPICMQCLKHPKSLI